MKPRSREQTDWWWPPPPREGFTIFTDFPATTPTWAVIRCADFKVGCLTLFGAWRRGHRMRRKHACTWENVWPALIGRPLPLFRPCGRPVPCALVQDRSRCRHGLPWRRPPGTPVAVCRANRFRRHSSQWTSGELRARGLGVPRGREGCPTCPIPLVRCPVASRTACEVPGQGITSVYK